MERMSAKIKDNRYKIKWRKKEDVKYLYQLHAPHHQNDLALMPPEHSY
jgi:hypothetical protein